MKRAVGLGLSALLLAGCKCEDDRPYTPYTVTVGPGPSASVGPAPSASVAPPDAGPAFAPRVALIAPRQSQRWQLEGHDLAAPVNRVFERAVVADFDGDAKTEVVAWTTKADELLRLPAGELWLYGAGAPRRLAELPGFVPTGPECTLTSELTQTGPHTVTLDSRGECKTAQLARTPARSLQVLAPLAADPILLGLRIADPAPGERFTFKVQSHDRDDDGQDDVLLAVNLVAEGSTRAGTAQLGWFQRGSRGLREAGEPARSLGKAASTEAVRAKSKKAAPSAVEAVGNLRRLASSLCAESGASRVFDSDGAPLKCGELRAFVDRTAEAEVHAALAVQDVLEASAVLERDDWYFGKLGAGTYTALAKSIDKQTSIVAAQELPAPQARPSRLAGPHHSPLAFQPSGALLVRTLSGVMRVAGDPVPEELLDVEAGVAAWPLEVLGPDGKRWTGVAHTCDRSELMLTISGAGAPIATRLLAARPGPCTRGAAPGAPSLVPLGWTPAVFAAVIAGSRLTVPPNAKLEGAAETYPGSPRSPDGARWAVATRLGVLVLGGERVESWRVTAPDAGAVTLSDCVVSSAAERLACIDQGRVRWFKRP